MPYSIFITPTATDDIAVAIEYYNALSPDLGYPVCGSSCKLF
jgi:hypothetical protein